MRRSAIAHAAYQYRVYAADDPRHNPLDSPFADFNPHPTGRPARCRRGFETAVLAVDGLNTNPDGESDPWLPNGAVATVANNVDAYRDPERREPDRRPDPRPRHRPGVFDHAYDVSEPVTGQRRAGDGRDRQLFYIVNWLHDWWYDSGFVEATGAGQLDNYGRGGEADDPMLVENQNGALIGDGTPACGPCSTAPRRACGSCRTRARARSSTSRWSRSAQSFTAAHRHVQPRRVRRHRPARCGEAPAAPTRRPAGVRRRRAGAIVLLDGGGCFDRSSAARALVGRRHHHHRRGGLEYLAEFPATSGPSTPSLQKASA